MMNCRATAVALLLVTGSARAQKDEPAPRRDAAEVVRDGTFNPQTQSARVGDQHVAAMVQGGYDTTGGAQGGNVNAFVEGALYHALALRVGINSLIATGTSTSRNVYSVGLRVGLVRQERHGIDVGLGVTYKSTGFTETTGEIEMALLLARRWNRLALYGNLIYGQGFISSERDGEVRLGLLYALGDRVNVGFDGLGRFDLGSGDPNRVKRPGETDFELLVGPVATLALGPLAFLVQAGSHTVFIDQTGVMSSGLAALAGVGTSF